ncbi:MAG: hypothetical protein R3Y43_08100 [Alphaproteobacteria bacterium]
MATVQMQFVAPPPFFMVVLFLTIIGVKQMKKKRKFKWENIKPNEKTNFEITYNEAERLLSHLQNRLQQLAAAYKAEAEK